MHQPRQEKETVPLLFESLSLLVALRDRLDREARAAIVSCVTSSLKSFPDFSVGLLSSLALEFQARMNFLPCIFLYYASRHVALPNLHAIIIEYWILE